MAGRRMDNGVGGQLGGKQNGLFYHWHGPEYEPDEPTDPGHLVGPAWKRSLDRHRVAAR